MESTIKLGKNSGPEAVEVVIDSLTTDVKVMLYLIYACRKGESVPEEVLRLMYAAVMQTSSTFSIEKLYTVGLVEPSPRILTPETIFPPDEDPKVSQAWFYSLRSVVRDYMDLDMAAGTYQIRSLLDILVRDKEIESEPCVKPDQDYETERMESEKTRVTNVLCALYFDRIHTEKVVRDAAIRASVACSLKDSNDSIIDGRRNAIGPIIWLLDQPERDDVGWTESKIQCARQVFLKYVCEGQLDGANISALLNLVGYPLAPLATLTAIAGLLSIEENATVNEHHVTILKDIVNLLDSEEGFQISIQEAASEVLFSMSNVLWKAGNEKSAFVFASTPGVLAVLVSSIQDTLANATIQSYGLAENAAMTLCNLSYCEQDSIKFQILRQDGAIESLVQALSKHNYPNLQTSAAITFRNLAFGEEQIKLQILSRDGALAGLVSSLSNNKSRRLQEFAAAALGSLARGGESKKLQILNEDGALSSIVSCLSKDDNPKLQENAALALLNLAHRGESNLKILNKDVGALAGLVSSLSNDNPTLQKHAAAAIAKLACEGEPTELGILTEDGAFVNLISSLSQDDHPDLLQRFAAAAAANVPDRGESKLQILNETGALAGLVKLLSKKNDNYDLQRNAVAALANLAAGEDSIKLRILKENGALAGLVNSLSQSDDPVLQKYTAWALLTLARGGEPIKHILLDEDKTLTGLVSSLSQRDNQDLRRYAAGALKFLSRVKEYWMKLRMSNEDLLLTRLIMCVSEQDDPVVQKHAQEALENLE